MSSTCAFVRKSGNGYEYGEITIQNLAQKDEKRIYNVKGECPTLNEALTANSMALEGQLKVKPEVVPIPWD